MNDLLYTKLALPQPGAPLVRRPRLLARLDAGFARRLTLVAAPAGYGKSTLVAEWLAARQQPAGAPVQAAWLTLDAGDNDTGRFWGYLVAACQRLHPRALDAAAALLPGPQPLQIEPLLTALLNGLIGLPGRSVLVLEDYHTISAPEIHATLAFLIERLPATLHMLIMTRDEPPLPLARLRAGGDLSELRAGDLRFTPAEIRTLLQQALAAPLPPELLGQIAERTEGWPAGLCLATLAIAQGAAPHEAARALAALAGSHQHIAAYFAAEVLAAQPEQLQRFLLATSVLDRLSGELCDAVAGGEAGQATLEAIERANLFLTPLDGERRWFRYHALFAEAMRQQALARFGAAHVRELHARASRWYAAQGLLADATEAALAAHDFEAAAGLIDQLSELGQMRFEVYTLRRWAEQLPPAVLARHPAVCLAYAAALLFSEDRAAPATLRLIEGPLELAERGWMRAGDERRLGTALALRALAIWWQGQRRQSGRVARRALALLPAGEHHWRSIAVMQVSLDELDHGQLRAAEEQLLEARALFEASANGYGVRAATLTLAEIAIQRGELDQAGAIYAQVLAEAADDPIDQGHALIGRAGLAYLRDDLRAAEADLARALALAEQCVTSDGSRMTDAALFIPASLLRARTSIARGAWPEAQPLLGLLAGRALQHPDPQLRRAVQAAQAELALALGDMVAVQRWANAAAQPGDDVARFEQEREALIVARWLIAQGERAAAVRAIEHWLADARAAGRGLSEIALLALLALAQAGSHPHEAAEALRLALVRAQASGAWRVFLDHGAPMAALLAGAARSLAASDPARALAERLLARFPSAPANAAPPRALPGALDTLAEPLSPQEQRVLRLLGAGLSNPEIADELVVSVNTVKTHVQSIYRKLGVNSRREARALTRAPRDTR